MKVKNANYYSIKFRELMENNAPIINNVTGETFMAAEGETFMQCYADTPERRNFPKFWFVSKLGNLLSIRGDKLIWVNKIWRKGERRYCYKYRINIDKDKYITKSIEAQNLCGLVSDSDRFGLANKLLEENGVFAFGQMNKNVVKVNGHHKDGDPNNNDSENIGFVSTDIHPLLHSKMPRIDVTDEKAFAYMCELGEVVSGENPDGFSIVYSGTSFDVDANKYNSTKYRDIQGSNQIKFSETGMAEMITMINAASQFAEEGTSNK